MSSVLPELSDGKYWIDPNGGDKQDALEVYCDMTKKATCIRPTVQQSGNISYVGSESEHWLSESTDGMTISYEMSSNQLSSLQMLSTYATQNISYHCHNSIAYFDSEKKNHELAAKLLAWDGTELTADGSIHLRYEVIEDGCEVNWIFLFQIFLGNFRLICF